jgi:Tfp pilus assembly protein PilO
MPFSGEDAMNLKQLPKEKRNNLILVALLTAMAMVGLGFGLIRFQYDHLTAVGKKAEDSKHKLELMKMTIANASQIETELAEITKTLAAQEEGMASGDKYSWVYETARKFKLAYRVDLPQFSTAEEAESTLLPKFPYRQVTLSVGGTGFYHDIGKFIADFENQFPHIRIVNLSLDPVSSLVGSEREKLEFKMQIVALLRPNPS